MCYNEDTIKYGKGELNMQAFLDKVVSIATTAGSKILLAIVVFIVGRIIINAIVKGLKKSKLMGKTDDSAKSYILSFVKIGLTIVLVVAIIGILGVPMASIITVLASAGVAVGLALQGALGNLAGGIMLMVFKPFKVGDYIEAGGEAGVVKEISLFYTVINSLDNKRITVPNGTLMNANVKNFSAEPFRRVDLTFACGKGEAPERIQNLIVEVLKADERVLSEPAEPFARLSGGDKETMEFTARAWVKNEDYWDVYFDLTQKVTEAFGAAGVKAPAVRVIASN